MVRSLKSEEIMLTENTMRKRMMCWLVLLALWTGVGAFQACAQGVSLVRAGSFEIGPFLGASYGIDQVRVMGGGNVTFAINKYILPYAEFSYFPGIGRKQSGTFAGTGTPYTQSYSIALSDFHGGFHIRLPIHEKPVVPYLVIGFGGLRNSEATVTATYRDSSGSTLIQQQLTVPSHTGFAVNMGGGIRYYINQRFGIRIEAKAYKPTGQFTDVFGKAEGGVFFQLR